MDVADQGAADHGGEALMPVDGEVAPAVVHGRRKCCRRCQAVLLVVLAGMTL